MLRAPFAHYAAPPMDDATAQRIARRLLGWYERHGRDLPWRRHPTPYRVWVSEVMLQQTVVATVIPYFERWMERFPDVESVARADEREVLAAWEGLGYYQRARRLHRAARRLMWEHEGRLPASEAALRRLPGVGPYIAAAILSIAFGQDVVALDANVVRVFMRLTATPGRGTEAGVRRRVRDRARAGLPPGRAAAYNQALMDFGSLVCRPRAPLCEECLLREECEAFRRGMQYDIPKPTRRKLTAIRTAVAVLVQDDRVYIQQRPTGGLFAGLWEFPGGKAHPDETPRQALRRECREELGVDCAPGRKLAELTHYYTVFQVRLHAFLCPPPEGLPLDSTHRWVPLEELDDYPMPSANRQVVQALEQL